MDKTPPAQIPDPPQKSVATRFLKDAFAQGATDPVSFITTLIRETVNLKASDVLIEPRKDDVRVRARVDGVLYDLGAIPTESYDGINSRIKVLSKLDPTEKRRIQEGQFTIEHEKRTVNIRVEIALTIYGEVIVIRIHEIETIIMNLKDLGFNEQALNTFMEILKSRSGLIPVCGPTGCGKTTTLYSIINHLNKNKNYNVMTIEDPVEFHMDGTNQMQTQNDIGFTFAEGLKTILRLSPDIILVGEIRDRETAEIAVESGLTGQLVISTIHADDAVGALFRLLDLGIEPYLLNSSITGIVAQRLIRKNCLECRIKVETSPQEKELFQNILGKSPEVVTKSKGCLSCKNLGFQGRTGIFEVLKMDAKIRDHIRQKISEDDLRNILVQSGFVTILKDGLGKAEQGITTVEEVIRNSLRVG